jgi:Amidase
MLAARVEQKNGTYLNDIQRDRQSWPSPTPVAVFGICPDRHSQAFAAVLKSGGKQPFHRRSDPEQATVVPIPCHQHQPDRQSERARLVRAMDERLDNLDALVLPTTAVVAPKMSEITTVETFLGKQAVVVRNTSWVNFFDLCAISLPLTATDNTFFAWSWPMT